MKRVFVTLLACTAVGAWCQNEPLFTSLCVAEKSVGFSWEKGAWNHAKFRADDKYIAQKIDPESPKYAQLQMMDTPYFCHGIRPNIIKIGPLLEESAREACYSIKDHGRDPLLMETAEKCFEKYDKYGALAEVQCKRFRFSPNGLFVALPSDASMDLSKVPKDGYKDSLNIKVGTCSKI